MYCLNYYDNKTNKTKKLNYDFVQKNSKIGKKFHLISTSILENRIFYLTELSSIVQIRDVSLYN